MMRSVRNRSVNLLKSALNILWPQYWRSKLSNPKKYSLLTPEEIEIRIWAIVVIMVMVVFAGITASMLYSLMFVVQPVKAMAPIDQAFVKMLNDIVLLLVGGIGGIMARKGVKAAAEALGTPKPQTMPCQYASPMQGYTQPYSQPYSSVPAPFGGMPTFVNPAFDESWKPGPPPTTPENHLHPEREEIAQERFAARSEES